MENLHKQILDKIESVVSVCDYETYEVLYLNRKAKEIYGENVGEKCWTFLHSEEKEICSFCPKKIIGATARQKREFVWENQHKKNKTWYEAHSQIIDYEGRKAVLEISYDISDKKKDEKQILNFLNYQNIISQIANYFSGDKNFNEKIDLSIETIGNQLGLYIVAIFEKHGEKMEVINIWSSENNEKIKKQTIGYSVPKDEINLSELHEKGRIKTNNIEKYFNGSALKSLQELGVESVFVLPLKVDNEIVGYFTLQDNNKDRKWHFREINLYKTIAEIFSNAIRRKQNEDEIRKTAHELQIANASKDKFFSIIAHDLKNPIYNVVNLSNYLKENMHKWDFAKVEKFVKIISEASVQASKLLENLLTWARSQTGKINPVIERFNLMNLIESEYVTINNLLIEKNQTFNFEYKCKKINIYADKNMIGTVLRNLMTNAVKYTPENGEIRVEVIGNQNNEIQILVIDNGVGIKKDDLPKLFQIDESISTPGTNNETGTGLGLILCREFIEKHDGKIWAESRVGEGSSFIFTIPLSA